MTNLRRSNFQAHPFHLVPLSPWPLLTCIALYTLTCDLLHGLVYIKRGSSEQSSDEKQDKQNEDNQAKDSLSETLKKLEEIDRNEVADRVDKGLPVRPKDFKSAQEIEKEYPTFFDEDSGNSGNKKQGYAELRDYLHEELAALPGTKETSTMEASIDRETKKPKSSSSDMSEDLAASQQEKASSSEPSKSSESKKERPIDYVIGLEQEQRDTEMPPFNDPGDS